MSDAASSATKYEHKAPPPSYNPAERRSPSPKLSSKKAIKHPSHNFSFGDDVINNANNSDLDTGTPPNETPESSVRKKSVRFGGDDSSPTGNANSVGVVSPSSRQGSLSNVVSPSTPRNGGSGVSPSPRSVLKRSADAEEIKRFAKKMTQIGLLLERLKKGDTLTKYYDDGVTRARHFYVSDDGTELRWCKPAMKAIAKRMSNDSKLILADVRGIVFGPRTERFDSYDWLKWQPYNCFSIIMDGRTLDIECKTREQFMTWFLGLQALCPLSYKFWNRSQLNWHRALYKTLQIAGNSGVDITTVWNDLVALSRKELASKQEYERRRSSSAIVAANPAQAASVGNRHSSGTGAVVLNSSEPIGNVVIRENLAKQALTILPASSPTSIMQPSLSSQDDVAESKSASLLAKDGGDSDDEIDASSPMKQVDMSIVTAPVDASRFTPKLKSESSESKHPNGK